MRELNPYTPGAGSMPAYLAGRDAMLQNAYRYLDNSQNRYPQRPVLYYGLRGVGKTVLLNKIEEYADEHDILYKHIEAGEGKSFTQRLIATIAQLVTDIGTRAKIDHVIHRITNLLKSFKISYSMLTGNVDLGIDTTMTSLEIHGEYETTLVDIFIELGRAAQRSNDTICFFVDEMQYLSEDEIGGLVAAMHRCNQLRLPITLFCAGLPRIRQDVGKAKSYAERLFIFEEVSSLNQTSAIHAIETPASGLHVQFMRDASATIYEITEGYPYFLQEFCSIVWDMTDQSSITLEDVSKAKEKFFAALDSGFFSVRYDKCSHMEQVFMAAMVKCGELPCTISNVALMMGRNVKSISPIRGKLINKGMIYATGHAEIDFTVPQFDGFILRRNPELDLS